MPPLSPQQTAEALTVSAQTLRRWSLQFAEFLSIDANPGRGRRRFYTVDDLAMLRRAGDLLRSHSVDETIALLRVPPEEPTPQALETLSLPDLIAEAKSLKDLVRQLRGEVAAQHSEVERLRAEVGSLFDRQRKARERQEEEFADLRAEVEALKLRRSWWQRFTRR